MTVPTLASSTLCLGGGEKRLKNKSQIPQVVGYLTTGAVVTICQDSESWGFWNLALPGFIRLVWWSGFTRLVWWRGSPGGKTYSRVSHAGRCLFKGWPPKPVWEGGPPRGNLQNAQKGSSAAVRRNLLCAHPPLPTGNLSLPQPGFCHQSGVILGSGLLPSALIPPSNKRFLPVPPSWPQEQIVALWTFALFLRKADLPLNGRLNGRLCKQNFHKRIKGEMCHSGMGKTGVNFLADNMKGGERQPLASLTVALSVQPGWFLPCSNVRPGSLEGQIAFL